MVEPTATLPAENEIVNPPVENPPAPVTPAEPPAPTAEQVAETNRLVREMTERMSKTPEAPGPSMDQVRQTIKDQTGLSDAGIDWVMQFNRETVTQAVAPANEKVAWMELRQAKQMTPEIESEMREELKAYRPEQRGDPVLLDKVYRMAVGTLQLKNPKAPAATPPNPIIGRRIVSNNPNPAGTGGSSEPKNEAKALSQEEKTIARKMGISEADYAKHKGNSYVTGADAPK